MSAKCLVVGATGGIGRSTVKTLREEGHEVRVLVRSKEKGEKYFSDIEGVGIIEGDASKSVDLENALSGFDHLFYCVNIPYTDWEDRAIDLLKPSLNAAANMNAKFVLPGNVYVYGRAQKNPVDEDHPWNTHTKKGKIRIEMEKMIKNSGAKWAIIRFPDFYGPFVINGFSEMLYVNALKNKNMKWIGEMDVPLEYIYIEDAGKAMAIAGTSVKSDGKEFNVPATDTITNREYLNMIKKEAGSSSKFQVMKSGFFFKMLGLFSGIIKEVEEMLYLKEEELILSGRRFKEAFGYLPSTSYENGIKKTFEWVKKYYDL